ncbi:hypothetical protein [Nonomuraea sp. NPDC050202]|uniref:hypothetical protein n=1 Tax=Nonomuraea sp. NPDC050202 TaxID=3155035 RepID=UPI0033C8CC45
MSQAGVEVAAAGVHGGQQHLVQGVGADIAGGQFKGGLGVPFGLTAQAEVTQRVHDRSGVVGRGESAQPPRISGRIGSRHGLISAADRGPCLAPVAGQGPAAPAEQAAPVERQAPRVTPRRRAWPGPAHSAPASRRLDIGRRRRSTLTR